MDCWNHTCRKVSPVIALEKRKLLLLDLDETLIYGIADDYELMIAVEHGFIKDENGSDFLTKSGIPVVLRPGVIPFLQKMFSVFDIGIWTSAPRAYAKEITNVLFMLAGLPFPEIFLTYEDCVTSVGLYGSRRLIKPLQMLAEKGYDLKSIVVIDDNEGFYTCSCQHNIIPTVGFYGDRFDTFLDDITPLLDSLSDVDDVTAVIKRLK